MSATEGTISALLPVHADVDPRHFAAALDSLLTQTRVADEIVIVEDGPLPDAHRRLIDTLEQTHGDVVRIALPLNQGAGVANQAGLEVATGTWIAKVDADDISAPERFARQLAELVTTGSDVCGASMLEFDGESTNVVARRDVPLGHTAIARRMSTNNPINHPTAMYRRSLAVASGGYPELRFMQDYVLFARLLASGARMTNIAEPLVLYRAGPGLHERRSDSRFAVLERQVQQELQALGLVSRGRALANYHLRMGYRRLPGPVAKWVHNHYLSKPVVGEEPAT
jgi:glycosyltransferase involved in cell wall biosynthesis